MKKNLAIVHVGFALTGVVTTLLGPLLPLLLAAWRLNDAQAGRLFTTQFVTCVTAAVLSGEAVARWGASRIVPLGMFLIAVGVVVLGLAPGVVVGMIGIGIYAVGLGLALPATNLLISELAGERRAAALNVLNFSWTLGAVLAPLVIAAMLKPFGVRGFLFSLAAVVFVIGTVEGFMFPEAPKVTAEIRNGKLPPQTRLWFAVAMLAFMFLYIGIENGFSGWVSAFTVRTERSSVFATALVQSSFWATLLLGRLIAPLTLRFIRTGSLIFYGMVIGSAGIVIALASPEIALLEFGVLLCGFGLGPVFPTSIALFTEWYGTRGTGSSIVLGACGLGGAVVPWIVGVVSDRSHNLRLGIAVTLACMAVAAVLHWRITAVTESEPTRAAGATGP